MTADAPTRRGTTNRNDRGSSYARRARRKWLIENYAANVPGFTRCYRCGDLLYNPDDHPGAYGELSWFGGGPGVVSALARPLTVDRIIPGCSGGTYRRNNIRPACGACNSETGGALARRGKK